MVVKTLKRAARKVFLFRSDSKSKTVTCVRPCERSYVLQITLPEILIAVTPPTPTAEECSFDFGDDEQP